MKDFIIGMLVIFAIYMIAHGLHHLVMPIIDGINEVLT